MTVEIQTREEAARGCGFRKKGGIYIVSDGHGRDCGRLPFPLEICPTCSHGIKPNRGWTWVNIGNLREAAPACKSEHEACRECPMGAPSETGGVNVFNEKDGLLWVGEKFYRTPAEFQKEAAERGISRRIKVVPHGFELGKTWVMLAHRFAIAGGECEACDGLGKALTMDDPVKPEKRRKCKACRGSGASSTPGVFSIVRPSRLEYVVKGDEEPDELERYAARGFTLVDVVPVGPGADEDEED